ncbi:UTRA domain-containing protein [Roseobacter denitrificans]|uniref:Histidine utilization repressor, putative n=1 Tax=Roseobacter denitrificans (strain ATCC 33942 / OCh 114) TaxID=375451 RepID=Q169K2_ROSDO|nr:GntR family transcriptional regulator [Roseobacter denitrificans]ABG31341.1 histidine utilization repressor, putative [Roseobacter denitrificans OCh 114]AVL55052.1 UTRA domain-containing protein [Roseobacter denitrificans]SFF99739.1 transcriptional regulator, GntR family [Roseobacter denitrificans OCh 114]
MTGQTRLSWTDVRDEIQARILDRTYAPGDKLPRDNDLALGLGCARTTVHRAMQDLARIGLVERKRKGGTHVRADPVTRATFDIPITRREVEQRGSTYDYRLISSAVEPMPESVLLRFGSSEPGEALHVKAVHLSDSKPYIFEDRWIDITTTPDILQVDLAGSSANEWLVRNKPYSKLDVRFFAVNAKGENAEHLSVAAGEALLVIERTTWIGSAPITTVRSVTAPGYQLSAQN